MIKVSKKGDKKIITIQKERADLLSSREIGTEIEKEIDLEQSPHIVIDFKKVEYIDSSFIGVLIQIHRKAQNRKTNLVFINVNENIKSLFHLTKLSSIFQLE